MLRSTATGEASGGQTAEATGGVGDRVSAGIAIFQEQTYINVNVHRLGARPTEDSSTDDEFIPVEEIHSRAVKRWVNTSDLMHA